MKTTITFIEKPYHKGFNWQVDFGGKAKQWYKSQEEAISAKKKWDEIDSQLEIAEK